MNLRSALAVLGVVSLLGAACAGTAATPPSAVPSAAAASSAAIASPPPASASRTASPQPSQSARPACPNPHGGQCLGPLAAGSYSTLTFGPTITYTVPAGWGNYEDLPGNVLLIPPGGTMDGVDAGTSDYIGIYSSIALDGPCTGPTPDVHGANAMAAFLSKQPEFATTTPRTVTVGGLTGVVFDIRLARSWKTGCIDPGGPPNANLMSGLPPSDFDHGLGGTLVIRLYLLGHGSDVLAIEVDNLSGGGGLNGYDVVVKSLRFGPG